MVLWWLFAIAFLLFALQYREGFTDPDRAISRPALTPEGEIPAIWQSRIDANSPISSNDMDYFNALQSMGISSLEPTPIPGRKNPHNVPWLWCMLPPPPAEGPEFGVAIQLPSTQVGAMFWLPSSAALRGGWLRRLTTQGR